MAMFQLHRIWTEAMKNSVKRKQPCLVQNLSDLGGIMEYLVAQGVFPDSEDVLHISVPPGTSKRKEQTRTLLSKIVKRTQKDYWTFVTCLYDIDINQGHLAEEILSIYVEEGGTIPPDVARLRRDYHDRHIDHGPNQAQQRAPVPRQQPLAPGPASGELKQPTTYSLLAVKAPAEVVRGPPLSVPVQASSGATFAGNQSMMGQVVTHDSESLERQRAAEQQRVPPDLMETDAGDQGQQSVGAQWPEGMAPTAASGDESAYQRARLENPHKVYKMESDPRGLALIINNENFHHLDSRTGTTNDQQLLYNLLNELSFDVREETDLEAKDMRKVLREFSQNARMREADSCIVAIMTHGSAGGLLYGVDGKVESSGPTRGTYIRTTEMRYMFSARNCPHMDQKPKLFILQACRGAMEDTARGLLPASRDVTGEDPPEFRREPRYMDLCTMSSTLEAMEDRARGMVPVSRDVTDEEPPEFRRESSYMDMCTVSSTLEEMVAYRCTLIPTINQVFRENAATDSFQDMMIELHRKMAEIVIKGDVYVAAEDTGNFRKKWFFNPPAALS